MLGCQFGVWQKGSDITHHFPQVKNSGNFVKKNGDIYKKSYEGLYCIGCETFYTHDELNENGECFEHLGKKTCQRIRRKLFLQFKKYEQQIKDKILSENSK